LSKFTVSISEIAQIAVLLALHIFELETLKIISQRLELFQEMPRLILSWRSELSCRTYEDADG
jgi:hypothetical protein